MSNHIGDTNKMVSETPRMKAAQMAAMEHGTGDVYRVGCDIECELNAAHVEIEEKRKDIVYLATEKAKLEDIINRAHLAFFSDSSDRNVSIAMHRILDEEVRKDSQ